ncbi:MAG: ComEC/Rec2 family competence protein [Pyrinomonadaceae bacterium]|nr:ComEC/Rec2 family competence protein [Pyrinomonadaceae bacterium]
MQQRLHTQLIHPYPLAQLAAAFSLGILAHAVFAVSLTALISIAALTTLLAVTAFRTNRIGFATILVTASALVLGATLASIEKTRVPSNQLKRLLSETAEKGEKTIAVGEPVEVTGVLERDSEIAPERWYLNVRVENIRSRGLESEVSGVVMLLVPVSSRFNREKLGHLDLRYGARIRVMTLLERSDSFRNPGVSSFTEYLDRKGYDATGFVKSPLLIERLENTRVFLPLAWLYEWRRMLQKEIDSRFSKETAGVLDATLLGNRYNLSRPTSERFREGGTFHVLVISGLHITFLGGLVFLIARRLTKNNATRFSLSVAVLWAYSLAVGAESSVVRAALMFTIVLLAPLVFRRANSLSALGGAALALLIWRPSDLLDPSFQLTFVSVLAIVVLAWPLLQKASEIGSWRPTRETPVPPSVAPWLRTSCENLFWSEREWKRELKRTNYTYKLFKSPLAKTLERFHLQRALRYAFAATVVSVSVQMTLLPFLVVYFHRLSFASLVLNIFVSLLMAAVAITAALGLLLAQISSALAEPLIGLTNALNWLMVHSVDPFARIGVASIRLPEYTGWASAVYGFYYVPLITLAVLLACWQPLRLPISNVRSSRSFAVHLRSLRLNPSHADSETAKDAKVSQRAAKTSHKPRRITLLAFSGQLIAVALIVFHPFSEAAPDGKLRIDFLDVGQGDAALVTMPDNTTLLIDGGGQPGPFHRDVHEESEGYAFERDTRSIGEAVVSEYLWWRGLDHVDYIIATHADADHIDGLNDVARNFAVRAALVARTPSRDAEYSKFLHTLAARTVPIHTIGAGDVLRFGNVSATVLWPTAAKNTDAPSANNDSVVLRLSLGGRSILLTADIETPAENALVKLDKARTSVSDQVRQNFDGHDSLQTDVVKVAHHGSRTSSTADFIAATGARLAVIPVGQTSMFGHPHRQVVNRWQASGAQVLTTGQQGTITVITDGRDFRLESFVRTPGP